MSSPIIKDKKILVTGGAGFIGSHMIDALISAGARVVVVDNLSTGRKENLNSKAKFYNLDVASKKLDKIFAGEKPDYVYHFAFNVLVPESVEDPIMDAQSIISSLNVIKNCYEHGVKKIIFSSSGFLYGNSASRPTTEDASIEPISPYVVSKHTVEQYLVYYYKTFGLPYTILRYAAVYGPRQRSGAMADYIRRLSAGKQAKIWGDGAKTRDYVYIDDVVRANLLALDAPSDIFNVGTGQETKLNNLYFLIAKLLNKKAKPIYLPDRPAEQLRYSLDYSKIKKALGWRPKVNLEEGLAKILNPKS